MYNEPKAGARNELSMMARHRLRVSLVWNCLVNAGLAALLLAGARAVGDELRIVAKTGDSTGTATLTSIDPHVSINDTNLVAFSGADTDGSKTFVVTYDANGLPHIASITFAASPTRLFTGAAINNEPTPVVATRDRVTGAPPIFFVRKWPSSGSQAFTTVGKSPDHFDSALPFVDVNDGGVVAFSALVSGSSQTALMAGSSGAPTQLAVYNGIITLRPQISNTNEVVIRDNLGRIILWPYPSGSPDVAAGTSNGFSSTGAYPGISADGKVVSFAGNRGSGAGVFVSVKYSGGRKLFRVAGEGLDLFTAIDDAQRIGVSSKTNGTTTSIEVVFVGTSNGKAGVYAVKATATESGGDVTLVVLPAGGVALLGDAVGTTGKTITSVAISDPISASGRIAFRADLSDASVAVILAEPDVELIGLEVNQSVQDWNNSIQLIKDKTTYVRAHLQKTDPASAPVNVSVQLRGFRGITQLPGSPLSPINSRSPQVQVKSNMAPRRRNFNDSANFILPDTWRDNILLPLELRLERTDGSLECKEPADTNPPGPANDCRVQVTFEKGSAVPLKLPLVSWKSPNGTVHVWDQAHINELVKQLVAMYPVASLPSVRRGTLPYSGRLPGSSALGTILGRVNKDLKTMRLRDGCAIGCGRLYYGVIRGINLGGEANSIPGIVASGDLPSGAYFRRNRHAHELGHVLGHDHASSAALFGVFVDAAGNQNNTLAYGPCAEVGNNPPKPNTFPNFFTVGGNPAATLGPLLSGENAKVFGLDTSNGPAQIKSPDPFNHFEVMSYCFNDPNWRWISDFTYKNLHSEIVAKYPPSLTSAGLKKAATVQDYQLFRGSVDLATNAAEIEPALLLPASEAPDLPPAGPYTLELRNGTGGVVSQVSFQPELSEPEPPATKSTVGGFLIPVPFNASIRRAVVLRDGVVLASRSANANSPTVTVTFPNGGENVTQDPVLLQWTGSDSDGDTLTYDVQFSADNGASWDTLAIGWPDQTLSVPHDSLKMTTTGLIRVIASDGFNTAADQSNAVFTVANNAPSVSISSPTAGQLFAGSQQVIFEAFATDVEDGLLSEASVQWTSSLDGSLGSGATLLKNANQLTPGNHTITVTATDSDALGAQASVNINVALAAPLTSADLTIVQGISPEEPLAAAPMMLTLTVSNTGPDTATGVTVTDTLPAGTSFGSAGATQGSCGQSSGIVTCSLGSLAADATATVTISVVPSGPGQKTNAASVAGIETDPVPADNSTTEEFSVAPAGPTISNPLSQSVCVGASAAFSATGSGTPPIVYRWRKNGFELADGGAISGAGTATLTINPTTADDSGNYDVAVIDGFGQSKLSAAAVLTVNGPPSAAIAGPAAVCSSRAGNRATVPSAGPGATYAWSIGNGVITSGAASSSIVFVSGGSGSVSLNVMVTGTCGPPSSNGIVVPIGACSAQPQSLVVDPAPDISNGNGILEPGETAVVEPSWKNPGGSPLVLSGTASSLTGPPGAVYSLKDPSANYGSIAAGSTNDCGTATANCYEIAISNPPTRPVTHWDTLLTETLSDGDAPTVWPLHIGGSFTDVPKTHTFYQFVERILHNGVTTGCGGTLYCPDDNVFRLQMAVFIARAQAGSDAGIPVSGSAQGNPYNCVSGGQSQFTDIDPTNPFCRHVHYIFSTGVTTGCITTPPRQYCPADNVTRGQMALFIARAVAGSDAAVPVSYGPDPVTGRSYSCNAASPSLFFTDITTSDIFCRHTHFLWAKNVISGFPDGTFGPALNVTRGAMAKFLANGFKLFLYGP